MRARDISLWTMMGVGVVGCFAALALALPHAGQAAEPLMMQSHGQVGAEPCLAARAWFDPNAPEAKFEFDDSKNCAFHQWAVQEFLYLIQTDPADPEKKARFLNMASPHALFLYKGDKPKPYPGGSDTQFKLGGGMASLRSGQGESNATPRIVFLPRTLKTENTTFDGHTQAGSDAVLIDQKGQVVYYTAQINKVYYDFIVRGDKGEGYYKKETLEKAAASTAFPVGTVEVKSSWRIAEIGGQTYISREEQNNYYTVPGGICQDKDCKSQVTATMALVGFHVVGTVKGHPEMVWATFEHKLNVPDCKNTPADPSDKEKYSFYKNNTNCGKAPFWENCNQIPKPDSKTPNDICRIYPYGEIEPLDRRQRDNTDNIKSINASYASFVRSPVWGNYFYAGSVWAERMPDDPVRTLINLSNANIRGSKKIANTSLESFTQERNCLHCHTYRPGQDKRHQESCFTSGDKNLYISHLIGLLCDRKP